MVIFQFATLVYQRVSRFIEATKQQSKSVVPIQFVLVVVEQENLTRKVDPRQVTGIIYPIGSMYAIYGNIYHQYTPNVNVSIYTIHGSYGYIEIPKIELGNLDYEISIV